MESALLIKIGLYGETQDVDVLIDEWIADRTKSRFGMGNLMYVSKFHYSPSEKESYDIELYHFTHTAYVNQIMKNNRYMLNAMIYVDSDINNDRTDYISQYFQSIFDRSQRFAPLHVYHLPITRRNHERSKNFSNADNHGDRNYGGEILRKVVSRELMSLISVVISFGYGNGPINDIYG